MKGKKHRQDRAGSAPGPRLGKGVLWRPVLTGTMLAVSVVACPSLAREETPVTDHAVPAPAESAATDGTIKGSSGLCETVTRELMGTTFEFTLYARPGDTGTAAVVQIAEEAFEAVEDLEARISAWRPDSQTAYMNNHAAASPVKVAPDILDLILVSQEIYRDTGGAFDITVGPLIASWGFYKGEGRLPTDDELDDALAKVGLDKVEVDRKARTVSFAREGVRLDFGGIGKGLALDYAAEVLREYGVTSAILHCGTSTVVAIGAPPGEFGWTVRVRHPYTKDKSVDEVCLRDASLSTSGSYEKFFELEGKKYCHIFAPQTGRPVEGMLSASAIAPTGVMSDALSTAQAPRKRPVSSSELHDAVPSARSNAIANTSALRMAPRCLE